MRIIDSNKDYYDFYQNIYKDDRFTFDRRDSYNLSREELAKNFRVDGYYDFWDEVKIEEKRYNRQLLLQICNTFWLFNLKILEYDNCDVCTKYDLSLLKTWKDYNKKPEKFKLSYIKFNWWIKYDAESKYEALKAGDFKTVKTFDTFYIYKDHGIKSEKIEKHIPILNNIGIPTLIDPLDIYLAFEEYFSTMKTGEERVDAVGMTNDDKIVEHGFDTKTSFRGK